MSEIAVEESTKIYEVEDSLKQMEHDENNINRVAKYVGKNIRMQCNITGHTIWEKDGQPIKRGVQELHYLYLDNINFNDTGLYTCRGVETNLSRYMQLYVGGNSYINIYGSACHRYCFLSCRW